jgi:hypothetical protein
MKLDDLLDRLQEFDLLLDTDAKFPSVTGLIAPGEVRGSWWAHPRAHEMYQVACKVRSHPDVLMIKLISRKVTFVHRPLWPAVFAIATAREPWQMRNLSKDALALLKRIDKDSELSATGDAVRELEARLLVHAENVHTERGFHAKAVQCWQSWARSVRLGKVKLTSAEARAQLEAVVSRINKQFGAKGTLPWQTARWWRA